MITTDKALVNATDLERASFDIYRPDLCAHYGDLMDQLPSEITPSELEAHLRFLCCYAYTEAATTLKEVVVAPGRQLEAKRFARLERIVREAPSQELLHACMEQSIPDGYHFLIVPRNGDYRQVLEMMNQIPNCIKPEEKERVAHYIQEDIDYGACVKIFGVDGKGNPQMYLRHYLTLSKREEPLLQIDAVEAGVQSYWTKVRQWCDTGRGKELLYSIALSTYLADAFGVHYLILGDYESDEIGRMIGCREVEVYGPEVSTRKIGLPPRRVDPQNEERVIAEGVFVNRLGSGSAQRTLDMRNRVLLENLPQEVSVDSTNNPFHLPERWKTHPQKQREIRLYDSVMDVLRNSMQVRRG
ncbi:hypothetical protein HYW21_01030 [Candidatus Woesearchaeota archaeon]|nr:hypothetical protein [Candidatus Woesearchaeota archaeon]